ncbi:MAG: signal recognition particle-docking protein FtsY [archaeon]
MFGFLKQKIADFGSKLKQTITKEEEGKKPIEEIKVEPIKEEKKTISEVKPQKEKTAQVISKPILEEKKQILVEKEPPKKESLTKKEEVKLVVEIKATETKPVETKTPEKKTGILGKLFGLGKKKADATPLEKKVEVKKKTKEEIANELEAKLFKEIETEVQKEGKDTITIEKEEILKEETGEKEVTKKPVEKEEKKIIPTLPEEEKIKLPEETIETEEIEEEEDIEAKSFAPEPVEKPRDIHIKSLDEDKRELKAKVGITGGLKGILFGGIEISEKQIEDLLWELELSLIESDVEQDAARELVNKIKQRLVGTKTSAKNIDHFLQEQIKEILTEMMTTEKINLLEETKKHQPLKILMLGPNGAGKTTSIAKLVNYFQKNKKTCIVAAADTFRAGAIDQLEVHANKLGVRVIKQQYGADPAAVAFDAVKAAEAGKIDVVLIDSAGRQETNKNLMEELRKIERVAKPDLKLYVGEAYVGQTPLDQVEEFKSIVGIDGFILTKIDTDAKGGTAISLLYKMKKPILFVGTGQGYDDFEEFTPEFILERII